MEKTIKSFYDGRKYRVTVLKDRLELTEGNIFHADFLTTVEDEKTRIKYDIYKEIGTNFLYAIPEED